MCPGQLCKQQRVPDVDPIWVPNVGTRSIIFKYTDPIFGTQNLPCICDPLSCYSLDPGHTPVQVSVFFQWLQWLYLAVLRGADAVIVNIDETPLTKGMVPRSGYNWFHRHRQKTQARAPIASRETRSHATLLACVTADPDLQRCLPQFVLTKDKSLSGLEKDRLIALPAPLTWVQGTAGWVTQHNLKGMLTTLRRCIRNRCPGKQLILVMDCAAQHTNYNVLAHASRLNLHVVLVPSGMTWLLQPLDSHVFSGLKRTLAQRQTRARGIHNNGELPAGMWVDIAGAGVMEAVVNKDWRRAMADNGLGPMCSPGRAGIQDVLGCCLPLPLMPPNDERMATLVGWARDGFRNFVLCASLSLAGARAALGPPGVGARIIAARWPGFAAVAAGEAVPPGAAASSRGGGHPGVAAAAVPPWAPRRTRSGAEY